MSNYTLWGLFGPATWAWWLAALSLLCLLWNRPSARIWARRTLAAAVAMFTLLSVLPTGYWLCELLEQRFAPPRLRGVDIRHIVVLSGAERLSSSARSGRPEVGSAAERIIEGARLARTYPRATLWIAGGVRARYSPHADIEWTALTWRELGIASSRIGLIDHTLDTCRNADGFADRRTQGEVLLVTSAMHMPRAVACFRARGVKVIPYPVDYQNEIVRSLGDQLTPNLLANVARADAALHEWIGLLVYRARGRTAEVFPGR